MASSHVKPLRDQMALTVKHLRRPSSNMLLKDYLRDDLSSCSSSGFKSFPRRQCCTAVRFDLLEKDLHAKRNRLLRQTTSVGHRGSCSFKVASSTISALHKASRAVINAVKLLPFPSISPTLSSYRKNKSMKRLLSKSSSRKMLSRSFWRKAIEEEEEESQPPARWKSFREFLDEKEKPSLDQHTQRSSSMISVPLGSRSTSESSSGKSNGDRWGSSSELTWEILRSTSDNSDKVVGVVSNENTVEQKTTATQATSEDSTDGCTLEKIMDWAREEKEQLSPVSVLNGPFGDDEEINSPLDSTSCCRLEGDETIGERKNNQMQEKKKKNRYFDDVASSLKPIDLEKRIFMLSEAREKSKEGSVSSEEEAWKVLNELEISSSPMNRAEKKLVLDLFRSGENNEEVSKVAREWKNVESQGVSDMGWEGCVREMDKCERWTNISDEQVGTQLESEVLTSLMNELVLELITQSQSSRAFLI